MSSVNPNAYCSNCHDLGHLAAQCTEKAKASPLAENSGEGARSDVLLPVQRLDSTYEATLEHRVFELERIVEELVASKRKRSEYMKDYMRKRRSGK